MSLEPFRKGQNLWISNWDCVPAREISGTRLFSENDRHRHNKATWSRGNLIRSLRRRCYPNYGPRTDFPTEIYQTQFISSKIPQCRLQNGTRLDAEREVSLYKLLKGTGNLYCSCKSESRYRRNNTINAFQRPTPPSPHRYSLLFAVPRNLQSQGQTKDFTSTPSAFSHGACLLLARCNSPLRPSKVLKSIYKERLLHYTSID